MRIVVVCLEHADFFLDEIINSVAPGIVIDKLICKPQNPPKEEVLDEYDIIWFEWGDGWTGNITHRYASLLSRKRVFCRIHSFEVLDGVVALLNLDVIDDLIFVSPVMLTLFEQQRPELSEKQIRCHIIPNGINVDRFSLSHGDENSIAFVANLNYKKDPMVLMHAFWYLSQELKGRSIKLHVAGKCQDRRYTLALPNFINANNLSDAITFNGFVDDISGFVSRHGNIICTSVMEGHPVGLMEGMACGLRPLIYHFPGAEKLYPPDFLWKSFEDLKQLFLKPLIPSLYRRFILDNFNSKKIARFWKRAFTTTNPVMPSCLERTGLFYNDSMHSQAKAELESQQPTQI